MILKIIILSDQRYIIMTQHTIVSYGIWVSWGDFVNKFPGSFMPRKKFSRTEFKVNCEIMENLELQNEDISFHYTTGKNIFICDKNLSLRHSDIMTDDAEICEIINPRLRYSDNFKTFVKQYFPKHPIKLRMYTFSTC